MAKTNFVDGNPALQIEGTIVTAAFLNALNNHRHRGLAEDGDGAIDYAADTGSANAYSVALSPALTAHVTGMPITFKAANANTGASTLNVNGLGAVAIKKNVSAALEAGDIAAGQLVTVYYEGTNYQLLNSAVVRSSSVVGAFRNLQASASGTSANISLSADETVVENSSNIYRTLRDVSLTINSSASGANGLDTGTLAASTWYSTWVIAKEDGTVAGLLSLSATAPTMPDGYTYKARTGWVRTDGTANKYPLSFKQIGKRVQYKVTAGSNLTGLPQMVSGTSGNPNTPIWSSVAVGNYVPTTASRISLVLVMNHQNTGATIVAPNNSYGSVSSTTNPPPICFNIGNITGYASAIGDMVLESANIYYASINQISSILMCCGWEDNI